jgi:hypothetical protein
MAMLEMANIFKQTLSQATAGVSWQPWDQGTLKTGDGGPKNKGRIKISPR